MRRALKEMPFDKGFYTESGYELCHATGYEVFEDGMWLYEYEDSDGNLYYG